MWWPWVIRLSPKKTQPLVGRNQSLEMNFGFRKMCANVHADYSLRPPPSSGGEENGGVGWRPTALGTRGDIVPWQIHLQPSGTGPLPNGQPQG